MYAETVITHNRHTRDNRDNRITGTGGTVTTVIGYWDIPTSYERGPGDAGTDALERER